MALLDRIQTDMTAAMRAKDEARLNAIRLIKTALKKLEVDSMKPLDENTELQVLNTLIKQRREAAEPALQWRSPSSPTMTGICFAIGSI